PQHIDRGPAPVPIIGKTAGGLPKRRRAVSVLPQPASSDPEGRPQEQTSQATAARIGAFARGTLIGRDTTTTEGPEDQ
ncbi:ATP-binding protein, partial [Streptomyces sp. SID625]|nr:ATP-binding protein [Streptomyces sp. SID625]